MDAKANLISLILGAPVLKQQGLTLENPIVETQSQ
jgi:hypothetical protein